MTADLRTIDMFSDKLGTAFVVDEPDMPAVELTLTEVTALHNYGQAARAPFSLSFTASAERLLPQRIYWLRHATMGRQSIFLVPIAGTKEKVTYQAIFN
jgi:hypothetical protein